MRTKPLSQRAAFRSGVVLTGICYGMDGPPCQSELGIKKTRTKTQLWHWEDDPGAECVADLPVDAGWRECVDAIAGYDRLSAPIKPKEVTVHGAKPYVGQVLALAWSADEGDQMAARLLARINSKGLEKLGRRRSIVLSSDLRGALDAVAEMMSSRDVDPSEIDPDIGLEQTNPAGLQKSFRAAVSACIRRQRAKSRAEATKRAPFEAGIAEILQA